MPLPQLDSSRFATQSGLQIAIETPSPSVPVLMEAVVQVDPLRYGDYDQVFFHSTQGTQEFRALGTGRNAATQTRSCVPCVILSFFLGGPEDQIARVIEAIYRVHPYEEPVIRITPCLRPLHIRGLDEDNPNRFWNAPPADWVPKAHR